MSHRTRRPYPAIVALLLALPGCAPQAALPGTVPVSGSQPAAGLPSSVLPGPASSEQPVRGDMTTTVVFPAGSLGRLQRGLSIKGLVSPEDLAADELANLLITVNGQTLTREQISFNGLEWTAQGEMRATLKVREVDVSGPVTLSVATPSRNLELRAVIVNASTGQTVIDVRSTAVALIIERLAQEGRTVTPEQIDERAVTLVANRLSSAIGAVGETPLLDQPSVTSAVTAGASSQADGTDPAAALSGGTGSGGSGGTATTTTTATDPTVVTGLSLQAANATVGLPRVYAMAKGGSTLFASFGGLIHQSSDDGATWTALAGSPYAYPLTVDGANLIGVYNDGIWSIPVAGGAKTVLGAPGQNGLPGYLMPHSVTARNGDIWFYNQGDGLVYHRPAAGGNWVQFGTGFQGGEYPSLACDGTYLYAGTSNGLHSLALSSPGGAWLTMTDPAAPAAAKELRAVGSAIYAASGDKVYTFSGSPTAWSSQTVDTVAGLTLVQLADDGTNLYVAGTATPNGKPEGRLYKRPLDNSTNWVQVGSSFRYPWDRPGLMTVSNGTIQLGAMHYDGTSWSTVHQQRAGLETLGAMTTAGGYVWLVDDDTVWRRPGASGAWTAVTTGLPANRYNPTAFPLLAVGDRLYHVPNQTGGQLYTLDATQGSPSWSSFGSALPGRPERLAADATHLYAGISGGGNVQIYRIPLAGGSWQAHGPAQAIVAQSFQGLSAVNGTVTICSGTTVYQYDGSWTQLGGAFTNASGLQTIGSRLFLLLSYQGVNSVVREWDGTTWQDFAGMPTNNNTVSFRASDRLVLGSPYGGLYALTANATTWTKVSDLNHGVSAVVYEPGSGRYFATTYEDGLLQTP
jgi:hypothetical protein